MPMIIRHATVTQIAAKDMKPCRNTPRKPSRSKITDIILLH